MERTHFTWLSYRFCPGIPQLLVGPLCPACGCHRELQVLQGLQCCQAHGERASLGFKFHIPWSGSVQGRVCWSVLSVVTRVVWCHGTGQLSGHSGIGSLACAGVCDACSCLASAVWKCPALSTAQQEYIASAEDWGIVARMMRGVENLAWKERF